MQRISRCKNEILAPWFPNYHCSIYPSLCVSTMKIIRSNYKESVYCDECGENKRVLYSVRGSYKATEGEYDNLICFVCLKSYLRKLKALIGLFTNLSMADRQKPEITYEVK